MTSRLLQFGILLLFTATAFSAVSAQTDASNDGFRRDPQMDPPKNFREMVARQRLAKDKKQHEEMIERAERALAISEQLGSSYGKNNQFSEADLKKLGELEVIVNKIRKELGGDDGDDGGDEESAPVVSENPSSTHDAFEYLQENAATLIDELKKTTRYTVSVVAIQSSNTVLKMVRFLRLRK